jgi:hypothetical protein
MLRSPRGRDEIRKFLDAVPRGNAIQAVAAGVDPGELDPGGGAAALSAVIEAAQSRLRSARTERARNRSRQPVAEFSAKRKNMKSLLLLAALAAGSMFGQSLSATQQKIGPFTYTNYSNGVSATTQTIGAFAYTNYSNGTSATTQAIGPFTYTNYSTGATSTTQTIAPFTYTNYSNGLSSTTQTISPFTYTNYSNGVSGTRQTIGNFTYYNWQR